MSDVLAAVTLSAAELEGACLPLLEQVRVRRVVAAAVLADATPADLSDPWAWLTCYGQLRAWLASPVPRDEDHAAADALVLRAINETPVLLPELGDGVAVYPKSFTGLAHLTVLSLQLDRFTARLAAMVAEGTTLEALDSSVDLVTSVSYIQQLIAWAWTSPGTGLPFDPSDAAPVVPAHVVAWSPQQLLRIGDAITTFAREISALHALIDPVSTTETRRRPSWSGFFESLGAEAHIDAQQLAVTHSLGKAFAMARLASDRHQPEPVAA